MLSINSSKRKRDDDQATLVGNDSSIRSSTEGSKEEIHGEEVSSATAREFSLLADEIKFLIFSFSHGNEIRGYGGSPVANLFKTCGFLSKDCYQCCIRHVQQNPMLVHHSFHSLHYHRVSGPLYLAVIAFMCKHRVKLENMRLDLRSYLDVSLSIYLLRRCDLTELRSITVGNSMQDRLYDSSDGNIAAAIAAGIPREAIEEYHPISPSRANVKEIIADILVEQAPLLTKINVTLFRTLDLSLLKRLSNQLEELTLTIYLSEDDPMAVAISQTIENMPKLKKLSFDRGWGSVRVRSQTLEEIDGRHSRCYVNECVCPSLKMFHCWLHEVVRSITGVQPATVKPVTPFTRDELKTEQDFKVGDRPFIGMTVPNSCIVRLSLDGTGRLPV